MHIPGMHEQRGGRRRRGRTDIPWSLLGARYLHPTTGSLRTSAHHSTGSGICVGFSTCTREVRRRTSSSRGRYRCEAG